MNCDDRCVTAWSCADNRCLGMSTADLLVLVRPQSGARHALRATHRDGLPLTVEHGVPVRAMAPHLCSWNGAKWLRRLTFRAADHFGFREVRGHHNRGNP
jgi:DMSO/TMAO reductase YedYZ molybdopterin-dependent catalytic subunit